MKNIIETLIAGDTILYPTDTVWGLGCDATNEEAVKKIYKLKNRTESKSLIILVSSIKMLLDYVENIPEVALNIIKEAKEPTTIIYDSPKNLALNTIASDNTIAIRIPKNEFCIKLINEFGKPIVSTSANISGEPTAKSFADVSTVIKNKVAAIAKINLEKVSNKSSRILKLEGNNIIVIRA